MKNNILWDGTFNFKLFDKDGNLKESWSQKNSLSNQGEQLVCDVMFGDVAKPATYYVRLFNDTPVETDGLADLLNEPATGGYSAQALNNNTTDFPTRGLDSGDYQVTSKEVTFLAVGGSIGPVTYAVLATSSDNSGKLVNYVALSQTRTLAAGESLKVTFTLKLQ